jgi:folate-binding protein YgfZ
MDSMNSTSPVARSAAIGFSGQAVALLGQFGVIDVNGADAASFLHNQLTNDVAGLDGTTARLGGYCSPKGRLLATLLYWRTADGIRLLFAADLQAMLQKRLSMFVMRSKAKVIDVSGEVAVLGLVGPGAAQTGGSGELGAGMQPASSPMAGAADMVSGALAMASGDLPRTPYATTGTASATVVRLPDAAGLCRYLWVGARESAAALPALATDSPLRRIDSAAWDWLEVRAGEPRITAATSEQFVPQMINFEVLGGVNFRKGCYPGQEIVARSQYRGTIKRRLQLAHASAAAPGDELFHSADPGQPCGMVVNAAPAPGGGVDLLAEVKLAALDSGSIHVGVAGPVLEFLALPYDVPALADAG